MFRFNYFSPNVFFSPCPICHVTSVQPITFLFQLIQVDTKEINKQSGTKSYFLAVKGIKYHVQIQTLDIYWKTLTGTSVHQRRAVKQLRSQMSDAPYRTITSRPSELVDRVAGFMKNTGADGA